MPHFVIRWLVLTLIIMALPYIIPGIRVNSLGSAIAAAAVLGILNVLVKPILVILTLPLTILTLGLFLLIINALVFYWTGKLVSGIEIDSFFSAFVAALVISLVNLVSNVSRSETDQNRWEIRQDRSEEHVIDLQNSRKNHWE